MAHKGGALVGFNSDTTELIKGESVGGGKAEKQNESTMFVSFHGVKKSVDWSGFYRATLSVKLRIETLVALIFSAMIYWECKQMALGMLAFIHSNPLRNRVTSI